MEGHGRPLRKGAKEETCIICHMVENMVMSLVEPLPIEV
jgi:hypothetical protein